MSSANLLPKEMISKYISRRHDDLQNLKVELSNLNYEAIIRFGHQIKGNASSFGFPELGIIATELEMAAIVKDPVRLEKAIVQFSRFLEINPYP